MLHRLRLWLCVLTRAEALESLVYRLPNRDVLSLAGAIVVAAVAGVLGTYLPARRATNVDILGTLRDS